MLLFLLFYTLTVNSQTIGKYAIVNGTIEFTSKANLETIKANSNELKGLIDPVSHSVAFRVANNSFLGFHHLHTSQVSIVEPEMSLQVGHKLEPSDVSLQTRRRGPHNQ